jgi:hypothetical protein
MEFKMVQQLNTKLNGGEKKVEDVTGDRKCHAMARRVKGFRRVGAAERQAVSLLLLITSLNG